MEYTISLKKSGRLPLVLMAAFGAVSIGVWLSSRRVREIQFGLLWRVLAPAAHGKFVQDKKRLLADHVKPGQKVIEIGPGTGVNLDLLPAEVEYIGVEPNPVLASVLTPKVLARGGQVFHLRGEDYLSSVPDHSVDVVLVTHVMCSVDSPVEVLRAIRRVLRPDGKFLFMEHVADSNPAIQIVQTLIQPLWKKVGGNCHLNRQFVDSLEAAGFSTVSFDVLVLKFPSFLVRTHLIGTASAALDD